MRKSSDPLRKVETREKIHQVNEHIHILSDDGVHNPVEYIRQQNKNHDEQIEKNTKWQVKPTPTDSRCHTSALICIGGLVW